MRNISSVRHFVVLAFTFTTAMLGAQLASAHGEATGIVLERHTLMTELRDANKIISAMASGKQTLERDVLAMNAETMSKLASRMAGLFPDTTASRRGAGSSTRQTAWREFARFSSIADELTNQAAALADKADSATREQLADRARALGNACKQCHKSYRHKKKH